VDLVGTENQVVSFAEFRQGRQFVAFEDPPRRVVGAAKEKETGASVDSPRRERPGAERNGG
jgi:hypothetical protein